MKINVKKICLVTANVIIIAILLIGFLIAGSLLPIENNYKLYSVMSGSMEPQIPVGSLALVVPTHNYNKGDIITFISHGAKSDKETTTHRIVSVAKDGNQKIFTTKGDANEDPDAKTTPESRVIGKYMGGIAMVGHLLKYLTTLPGLIALILVPALFIIIEEIRNIILEIKKIKRYRALALER